MPSELEMVSKILEDHQVWSEVDLNYGTEVVGVCKSCGYFGQLSEIDTHTAELIAEYIEMLQVKAWDKGYSKGRLDASAFNIDYSGPNGKLPIHKISRNPYVRRPKREVQEG